MKRLVLIDGKSVFYRGYYAMGALSLPDGLNHMAFSLTSSKGLCP